MSTFPEPFSFVALDACHQQIQIHLAELATLAQQIDASGVNARMQQQANAIEIFLSGASRRHHAEEEKNVFPLLLASDDQALVTTVRSLQQDHGWIEENWIELAPQLRAIASGNNWFDAAEFQHNVEVFLTLCHNHIALEEQLIYPQAKARSAQIAASTTRPCVADKA